MEECANITMESVNKLIEENDRLRAENKQLKKEVWETFEANGDLAKMIAKRDTEKAELLAECDRLKELFALKWDATQSAETVAIRAENAKLLAALREMVHCYGNHDDEHTREIRAEAKAAIARAEGK